jgi:hypothetical protein
MADSPNPPQSVSWPFFIVGILMMLFAFDMANKGFQAGHLTADQRFILLWILPLASGFMCGAFAGKISTATNSPWAGWAITATGGFAVWILSFFLLPKAQ